MTTSAKLCCGPTQHLLWVSPPPLVTFPPPPNPHKALLQANASASRRCCQCCCRGFLVVLLKLQPESNLCISHDCQRLPRKWATHMCQQLQLLQPLLARCGGHRT